MRRVRSAFTVEVTPRETADEVVGAGVFGEIFEVFPDFAGGSHDYGLHFFGAVVIAPEGRIVRWLDLEASEKTGQMFGIGSPGRSPTCFSFGVSRRNIELANAANRGRMMAPDSMLM